jgi:hypothetical protein
VTIRLDIDGTDSAHAILAHVKLDDIICGGRRVADNCFATEKNIGATGIGVMKPNSFSES